MISSFRAFAAYLLVSEELCNDTDCVICLCKIQRGKKTDGLRCRHVFHKQCFAEWVRKSKGATCPLCRVSVVGDGGLTAADGGGGDGGVIGSGDFIVVSPFGVLRCEWRLSAAGGGVDGGKLWVDAGGDN
ncbi:E3 ubiquitin-protein ligase RHA1B-like [Phalaenopsis equestris]|uniref:E3 ubiquitin-protein ligase RHA1B-like n=1 Tax=Phalaenopsis equestris TaxID=78828 RepID=UPI0009E1A088|nr:E3 ubiquitin-protein ligase RHA1B-like [Phalaenopsis equestris]